MNYTKSKELTAAMFVRALMFSDKEDSVKSRLLHHLNMNDYGFFIDLKSNLQNYIFEDYVEDSVKERIKGLITLCASQTDDEYMTKILHAILSDCELMNGKNASTFYREELAKRKANPKYLKISDADLALYHDDLFKSLATDYDVARTHSPAISEDEFRAKYVEHFSHSRHYLESVRALLPEIDQENRYTFKNKVLMVTDNNNKHIGLNPDDLMFEVHNLGVSHIIKGI